MIEFYGNDISLPAHKVRFVLHHLALEYEYKRVNIREGEQNAPELMAISRYSRVTRSSVIWP